MTRLEGQVVGRSLFRGGLCRWEGCRLLLCGLCAIGGSWRRRESSATGLWLHAHSSCLRCCRVDAVYLPCRDVVEPAAVVFVGVDVEADAQLLATLDVHRSDAVITKDSKTTLTRILLVCLDDIVLTLPCVACSTRNAFSCCKYSYYLSFYFHNR